MLLLHGNVHFWNGFSRVTSKVHLFHLLCVGIGPLMKSAGSSSCEGLRHFKVWQKLQVTLSYNKKALDSRRSLALALLMERAS